MRREATARGAWYALGAVAVAGFADGSALGAVLAVGVACLVVASAPAVGRAFAESPRARVARALRSPAVRAARARRQLARRQWRLLFGSATPLRRVLRCFPLGAAAALAARLAAAEPSVALPDGGAPAVGPAGVGPGGEALGPIGSGAPPNAGPRVAPPSSRRTTEDQTADDANGEGSVSRRCGVPIRVCNNDGEADDHGAARDGGDGSTPLGGV